MNTTDLIREWSMEGARRNFQARFQPPVDILGVLSSRTTESPPSAPSATQAPLLVKRAGGGEWQPLRAGI